MLGRGGKLIHTKGLLFKYYAINPNAGPIQWRNKKNGSKENFGFSCVLLLYFWCVCLFFTNEKEYIESFHLCHRLNLATT